MNLKSLRPAIYIFNLLLALAIFVLTKNMNADSAIQAQKLIQIYALVSLGYLYLALLASPLYAAFPTLPYKGQYVFARRALGVSAFFFAALHVYMVTGGSISVLSGFFALEGQALIAIVAGMIAFWILAILAVTSFDVVIQKLTYKRWKFIHRLVYLAGILIVIHAVMLGSHFVNLSTAIPYVFWIAFAFLLILEVIRITKFVLKLKNSVATKA